MLNFFFIKKINVATAAVFFCFFLAILLFGQWYIPRTAFYTLLIWQIILYAFFAFFYFYKVHISLKFILALAIVSRVASSFLLPSLSDDVYRFIWDGQLIATGNNPLLTTPNEYIKGTVMDGTNLQYFNTLHSKINHPQYYTCYPPFMQTVFWLAAYFGNFSLQASIIIIKLTLSFFDILGILFFVKILNKLQLNVKLVLLYALNPLVIIEGSGNAHFEVVQVAFMLGSLYAILHKKNTVAACLWGLAITTKLLPLLLLPLWLRYLGVKKGVLFCVLSCSIFLLSFLPFLSAAALHGFSKSLHLYFQNFEFNASLYYLAREVGWWVKGYNFISFIGPLLMSIFLLIYAYYYFKNKRIDFIHFANLSTIIFSLYYFFATTVHPWYIINMLPYAILANRKYPIVWLALAFLSYNAYSNTPFKENYWLCFFEYFLLVVFMIYDYNIKHHFKIKTVL